ncbi:MAG: DUF3341 domain-containing protein [Planctomycetota bacterium]|jgi:hypothetical protein
MAENHTKFVGDRRFVLAVFNSEEEILAAASDARQRGLSIADAYTPYAVHGLDKAMDLRPSRLPWVCFALGLAGATFKVWFEFWTSASAWPINVGGKPWNSLPAFVPVTFEVMVLFAALSTVAAFLVGRRLLPGKRSKLASPGVTDDEFALVIEETDASFRLNEVRDRLREMGATSVEERIEQESM